MSEVSCPQCGLAVTIVPSLAGQVVGCPQCQFQFVMPAARAPAAPSSPFVSVLQSSASQRLRPSNSLLDIFDFRFEKFVTPIIIRVTWILALVAVGLFATMGTYTALARELSVKSTRGSSVEPKSQLELRMPDLGGDSKAGTASSVAAKLLIYGMWLIGLALLLLWIRVSLEMTIVAFNIATSLQSIDKKTKG